ncbi:MAG: heavy metal translocating P-type ATPase [Kiritimatiellae bacterium]|nr:heavy metal translocating P-type ATPase [Kiritimatiellia bacterium]MDW8457778.1 heavy metal translocating P-type ATPase [Verrucomicrobiota bacterium]
MNAGICPVRQLADKISEREDIRAVFLDARAKKISIARLPGPERGSAQSEVRAIAGDLEPDQIARCAQPPWKGSCERCGLGPPPAPPKGIRLVYLPDRGLLIERESCATAPRFWRWSQFPWVRVQPLATESIGTHPWKLPMALAVACGLCTLAGWWVERIDPDRAWLARLFYAAGYVAGGWDAAVDTLALLRKRVLDIHFLMLAVAAGAAAIGHWWEGGVLLFLFSISGALEDLAQQRTERAISSLFKEAPKTATVLENGAEREIPVDDLRPGMLLAIRPGDVVPVDAQVVHGRSAADESNLTGESTPVDKEPGDTVFAGTINLWGRMDCRVLRPAAESALAKIIRMIQEARESKAPAQRFTDRFGSGYTISVLVVCTAMFLIWHWAAALPWQQAFYRAMTLLVVASPCALAISIPSAVLAGIAAGARRGILFRGGAALEKLASIRRVAMDKTGTLTSGTLRVVSVEPCGKTDVREALRGAAALASHANHPVSSAIHRHALDAQLELPPVDGFRALAGSGVMGVIEGREARLGQRRLMGTWASAYPVPPIGMTESFFEWGEIRARFLLQDEIRRASKPLLERLRQHGLAVAMLTGDRPEAARAVADEVGLSEVHAGLAPEDKVRRIREWSERGERPAMIGDGVNDAPSLAAAYVGVAMGMRGADAALEQADVVLMKDRLDRFAVAYELSRAANRIIKQNLAISLGSVVLLSMAAFAGVIPLTVGVIGHEGSTLLVVLNSLRLLFVHLPSDRDHAA